MKIEPNTYEHATIERLQAMQNKIMKAIAICESSNFHWQVRNVLRDTTKQLFTMNASAHVMANSISKRDN